MLFFSGDNAWDCGDHRVDLREAMMAEKKPKFGEWRPMKTAPKDGSTILLSVGWSHAVAALWNPAAGTWCYVWGACEAGHPDEPLDHYFERETTDEADAWMPMPNSIFKPKGKK